METFYFGSTLLVGFFLWGICIQSSLAFPPTHYTQHAFFQKPQFAQTQSSTDTKLEPQKEREQVNTVSVTCHPDSVEIVIKADMFAVGAPVNSYELRLGVDDNDYCRATASSVDEYRIVVGLADCGTKHWMTEDSLVYTNLLIYAPVASPNGVIWMDEAVIPIECHYDRKYSLSSSPLMPTWIPFMSTQAAVETLKFDLRLMTNDWLYERGSNVYYLGEPISIEASVRVGHHMGLRVFLSSCVATLKPDIHSEPRYIFIDNGCLADSQISGSKSHFLPRTQDDKLQLVIDAFKFHNDDRGELYITCHLNAVPVHDAEAPNKACTLLNGRWRSADGNDFLCGYCQSQNEVSQTHSKLSSTGRFAPRGFGRPAKPEPSWRSGLKTNKVWEQEARLGPMTVLTPWKRGPLPVEELPPVLNKISRPALYGSQWRSGINTLGKSNNTIILEPVLATDDMVLTSNVKLDLEKGLLPDPPTTPDLLENEDDNMDLEETKDDAPLEKADPDFKVKSQKVALDSNTTAAPSEPLSPTPEIIVEETTLSNATQSDPKK